MCQDLLLSLVTLILNGYMHMGRDLTEWEFQYTFSREPLLEVVEQCSCETITFNQIILITNGHTWQYFHQLSTTSKQDESSENKQQFLFKMVILKILSSLQLLNYCVKVCVVYHISYNWYKNEHWSKFKHKLM